MNTDDLIKAMAADLPNRPTPPGRALGQAVLVSVPIALGLFLYALKVRPDIAAALQSVRFDFKLASMGLLALTGLWLANRLSRPGTPARPAVIALMLVLAALLVAVGIEMMVIPSAYWMPRLVGTMSMTCLTTIPVMAAGPLAAMLFAMRQGAPTNTTAAGAAAGLVAGGIGAFFYAPACINDSPLYIAVWYLLGIAAVVVAGALAGRFALKW